MNYLSTSPTLSDLAHWSALYFVGLSITLSLATVWLKSNLPFYLLDWRMEKIFGSRSEDKETFIARAAGVWGKWADLLVCSPCSSTWFSVVTSVFLFAAADLPLWMLLAGPFLWTGWIYRLLK